MSFRVRASSKAASKARGAASWRGRGPAAGAGAFSAKRVRAIARSVVSGSKETKRECLAWSGSLVPGVWQTFTLNSLSQGDTSEDRDGLEVYEQGCTIRYRIIGPTDRYAILRVMLVRAKEVALVTTDLPTNDLNCINNDMHHQFEVLRDFNITMVPRSTGSGQTGMPLSAKIKLKKVGAAGKKIAFTGTGAGDHAAGSKLVLCLLHATNDASGTDNPDFNIDSEYSFKEC